MSYYGNTANPYEDNAKSQGEMLDEIVKAKVSPVASPLQRLDNEFRNALDELHVKITDLQSQLSPLCAPEPDQASSDPTYPYETEFESMLYGYLRSVNYAFQRLVDLQGRLRV